MITCMRKFSAGLFPCLYILFMLMMMYSCILKAWVLYIVKGKNPAGKLRGKRQMMSLKVRNKYDLRSMEVIATTSAYKNEL